MPASNHYLAVLAHIRDCFHLSAKGLLEKCSTPSAGVKSRGTTQGHKLRFDLSAFQLFTG